MAELRVHEAAIANTATPRLRIHEAGAYSTPAPVSERLLIHSAGVTVAAPPPVGDGGVFVRIDGVLREGFPSVRVNGAWV